MSKRIPIQSGCLTLVGALNCSADAVASGATDVGGGIFAFPWSLYFASNAMLPHDRLYLAITETCAFGATFTFRIVDLRVMVKKRVMRMGRDTSFVWIVCCPGETSKTTVSPNCIVLSDCPSNRMVMLFKP